MKKKNGKRRYPFPEKDEKRNKELRDARAVNTYGEKPLDARNIGLSQSAYNREVNNEARRSFKEIEKTREQLEFIEALPKLKARKEASLRATIRSLSSKSVNKWTVQETEAFQDLSPKLQRYINEKHKRKHGI